MDFNTYNKKSSQHLFYPHRLEEVDVSPMYLSLGVCGEAGELAEKVKKCYRDSQGQFSELSIKEIEKEVGDVLWYLNRLAEELGFSLGSAAQLNLIKLEDRVQREVLRGSGDNR